MVYDLISGKMPLIVFGSISKHEVYKLLYHESRSTHVDVTLLNGFTMTIDKSEYPWHSHHDDLVVETKSKICNLYRMFLVYNDLIRGIGLNIQLQEAVFQNAFIPYDIEAKLMELWDIEDMEYMENNQLADEDEYWPQNQLGHHFEDEASQSETLEWLFPEGNC